MDEEEKSAKIIPFPLDKVTFDDMQKAMQHAAKLNGNYLVTKNPHTNKYILIPISKVTTTVVNKPNPDDGEQK